MQMTIFIQSKDGLEFMVSTFCGLWGDVGRFLYLQRFLQYPLERARFGPYDWSEMPKFLIN